MAGEFASVVPGGLRNLLCRSLSKGNATRAQSELLGIVGWLQILGPSALYAYAMDINKTHRSNERVQPPWPEDMEEALRAQGQWLQNQKVSASSGVRRKRDVETFTASLSHVMQKTLQERILPLFLHLFTAVTGLVDAVSYIALGHVFTANMTGNIVFLGFALAGVPGVSALRCLTALAAFLIGALIGGRLATTLAPLSTNRWRMTAFGSEALFLLGATLASIGYVSVPFDPSRLYAVIVLTALAMGLRNATVRKIAQPDLTTTVLTLTITGLAADSSFAGATIRDCKDE